MWIILISLAIGTWIGINRWVPERYMKYNSRFQQLGIVLLLFAMGAGIGSDQRLLQNLKTMGVQAVVYACITTVFSILVVYILSTKFLKGDRSQ